MSLRRRVVLACIAAAALAVVFAAVATWLVARDVLYDQVDDALRTQADALAVPPPPPAGEGPTVRRRTFRVPGPAMPTDAPVLFALVSRAPIDGNLRGGPEIGDIEIPPRARNLRKGDEPVLFDAELRGTPVRFLAAPARDGGTVLVARPTTDVRHSLRLLGGGLAVVVLLGVGLAAAGARLGARTAIRPVADLTEIAEEVAATRDLSRRIAADGDGELARLAASFNRMLRELEASDRAQRRLVADASHELRTPLTSLRLNLQLLTDDRLDETDRDRLRADLVAQIDDLTRLLADLIELARDESPPDAPAEQVDLAALAGEAVARAERRHPDVRFVLDAAPATVEGWPAQLDRAVANLLDNAARFSPTGAVVEVVVRSGEMTVRDHGPGIPDAERERVFERFYRAPSARGTPGTGLGLAIVRSVALAHGGTASAEAPAGGGALLRLTLG